MGIDPVLPRLESAEQRQAELEREIGEAAGRGETRKMIGLQVEYKRVSETAALYGEWKGLRKRLDDARAVAMQAADEKDSGMMEMAAEEEEAAGRDIEDLEGKILAALAGGGEEDERNVFLEIRAAAGGDEASLFAGDLLRMYERFCEHKRWEFEVANASQGTYGGYKEVVARVCGKGAYGNLKYESGGHRVQRVPETESQGRIHTSVCTVAVIPEAKTEEVRINPEDLKIETFRASGAGGQHVNKTDSAVRIRHLPTSTVVECQSDRSQHRNKEMALAVLRARIHEKQEEQMQSSEAQLRRSQVGTGERSEKIRTYNFPQGRVTDHRIKLTLHSLGDVMEGEIDPLIAALQRQQAIESALNPPGVPAGD